MERGSHQRATVAGWRARAGPRRCVGCGASLAPSARWCGGCGTPCVPPSTRAVGPRATGLALLAVTATVGLVMVVTAIAPVPGRVTAVDLPDPAALPPPLPPAEACQRLTPTGPCGWTVARDAGAVTSVAGLDGDGLLVGRRGGEVLRVDLATGRRRWSAVPFPAAQEVTLRTDEGAVLAIAPDGVARLDPGTGRTLWARTEGHRDAARPLRAWALDDGVLVLGPDGELTALDLESGEFRWRATVPTRDAVFTGAGLLTVGAAGSALWHPATGAAWEQEANDRPRLALPGERPDGPLPLAATNRLLDPATGEQSEVAPPGPTILRVLGPVTLQLTWPSYDRALDVTALGPRGEVQWVRTGLDVPCCHASVVPAGRDRAAITAPGGPAELLSLVDGGHVASLERPARLDGAILEGVAGDLAVWRRGPELLATSHDGGRVELWLPDGGSVLLLEPLVLTAPDGVVAVDPHRRGSTS